jgi:hypothetical protein
MPGVEEEEGDLVEYPMFKCQLVFYQIAYTYL